MKMRNIALKIRQWSVFVYEKMIASTSCSYWSLQSQTSFSDLLAYTALVRKFLHLVSEESHSSVTCLQYHQKSTTRFLVFFLIFKYEKNYTSTWPRKWNYEKYRESYRSLTFRQYHHSLDPKIGSLLRKKKLDKNVKNKLCLTI